MSWNYRIIKCTYKTNIKGSICEESSYSIYEVYYNKDDTIKAWSSDPIAIHGDSKEELKDDLERYMKAFQKPILDYNKLYDESKKELPPEVEFGIEESKVLE